METRSRSPQEAKIAFKQYLEEVLIAARSRSSGLDDAMSSVLSIDKAEYLIETFKRRTGKVVSLNKREILELSLVDEIPEKADLSLKAWPRPYGLCFSRHDEGRGAGGIPKSFSSPLKEVVKNEITLLAVDPEKELAASKDLFLLALSNRFQRDYSKERIALARKFGRESFDLEVGAPLYESVSGEDINQICRFDFRKVLCLAFNDEHLLDDVEYVFFHFSGLFVLKSNGEIEHFPANKKFAAIFENRGVKVLGTAERKIRKIDINDQQVVDYMKGFNNKLNLILAEILPPDSENTLDRFFEDFRAQAHLEIKPIGNSAKEDLANLGTQDTIIKFFGKLSFFTPKFFGELGFYHARDPKDLESIPRGKLDANLLIKQLEIFSLSYTEKSWKLAQKDRGAFPKEDRALCLDSMDVQWLRKTDQYEMYIIQNILSRIFTVMSLRKNSGSNAKQFDDFKALLNEEIPKVIPNLTQMGFPEFAPLTNWAALRYLFINCGAFYIKVQFGLAAKEKIPRKIIAYFEDLLGKVDQVKALE